MLLPPPFSAAPGPPLSCTRQYRNLRQTSPVLPRRHLHQSFLNLAVGCFTTDVHTVCAGTGLVPCPPRQHKNERVCVPVSHLRALRPYRAGIRCFLKQCGLCRLPLAHFPPSHLLASDPAPSLPRVRVRCHLYGNVSSKAARHFMELPQQFLI